LTQAKRQAPDSRPGHKLAAFLLHPASRSSFAEETTQPRSSSGTNLPTPAIVASAHDSEATGSQHRWRCRDRPSRSYRPPSNPSARLHAKPGPRSCSQSSILSIALWSWRKVGGPAPAFAYPSSLLQGWWYRADRPAALHSGWAHCDPAASRCRPGCGQNG